MKPESRLDIAGRHVAEAGATVARQKLHIRDLEAVGHPTGTAYMLLELLEDGLRNAKEALALMRAEAGEPQH